MTDMSIGVVALFADTVERLNLLWAALVGMDRRTSPRVGVPVLEGGVLTTGERVRSITEGGVLT